MVAKLGRARLALAIAVEAHAAQAAEADIPAPPVVEIQVARAVDLWAALVEDLPELLMDLHRLATAHLILRLQLQATARAK